MVEYSVLVALIAVVCIAVIGALGTNIFDTFKATNTALTTAAVPNTAAKDPK